MANLYCCSIAQCLEVTFVKKQFCSFLFFRFFSLFKFKKMEDLNFPQNNIMTRRVSVAISFAI